MTMTHATNTHKNIKPSFPAHLSPVIQTKTTIADANRHGDIFGGWILAQMDLVGGITAHAYVGNRVVTAAVDSLSFVQPVFVGDDILFFAEITRVGNTSIAIKISGWVYRNSINDPLFVTEGLYTFVSVDSKNGPQTISLTSYKDQI
jgi:acyl-CoA thioesterase YciA